MPDVSNLSGRAWAGHGQGMGRAWAGHGQGMGRAKPRKISAGHRRGIGGASAGHRRGIGGAIERQAKPRGKPSQEETRKPKQSRGEGIKGHGRIISKGQPGRIPQGIGWKVLAQPGNRATGQPGNRKGFPRASGGKQKGGDSPPYSILASWRIDGAPLWRNSNPADSHGNLRRNDPAHISTLKCIRAFA